MQKLPALFIGRFQPFHNGHLSVVQQALADNDFLIIGIGSAEDNYLPDNPFTAGERWEMITAALDEAKIPRDRTAIIPVRNINHYALWVDHVEKLIPPFGPVYSGSPIVQQLFKDHGKHPVVTVTFEPGVSGTGIREAMKANKTWETLVPPTVASYLKTKRGPERIQSITP